MDKIMYLILLLSLLSLCLGNNNNIDTFITAFITSCDDDGNPIGILENTTVNEIDIENSNITIEINKSLKFQTITGFGAGLPQSSAYVLSNLKINNLMIYNQVMQQLFNSSIGAGLSIIRFPIGSCDFSIKNTSYDEYNNDYKLNYFDIDPDSLYIVNVLQDALFINPNITIIASPWSSPSWLKLYDSLLGINNTNTLINKEEVYETYANYFNLTYNAFLMKNIKIDYLTLQNEPLFGDNEEYPGMYLDSEHELLLGQYVNKILGNNVKLLAYDHNFDVYQYPLDVLTKQKNNEFIGTAWHCYGGDMKTALSTLDKQFPTNEQHITECTSSFPNGICDINTGMINFGYDHEWDMQNIFLGPSSYNSKSGTKWIIALDEVCGPVLSTVTFRSGRPFVSIPNTINNINDIKYNQDYYTTMHVSKFIKPGSIRVKSNVKNKNNNKNSHLTESFYYSDSNLITSIVMNLNHTDSLNINIIDKNVSFNYILPKWSTAVFQWNSK